MNKAHRTVWSEATGNWVAAPETAKGKTRRTQKAISAAVSSLAMALGGGSLPAEAAGGAAGLEICENGTDNGINSSNCALPSSGGVQNGWGLFTNNGAGFTTSEPAFITGVKQGYVTMYGQNGVYSWSDLYMNGANNVLGGTGTAHKIKGLAAGDLTTSSQDAVNGSQLFATNQSINNLKSAGTTYFHANSTGADSTASGVDAIAIGTNSVASAASATAFGQSAMAYGAGAVAIGDGALAGTAGRYADGQTNVIAIGTDSHAYRPNSIALGYQAQAETGTTYDHDGNLIAIGTNASASGDANVAIGKNTVVGNPGYGNASVALGDSANAVPAGSTALGAFATVSAGNATAIGKGANASIQGSVALGANSTTEAPVSTTGATIGGTAYTYAGRNATSTVSVGSAGAERTVTNVAAGRVSSNSTDAVNGSQLYAADQAINQNTTDISNTVNTINAVVATGTMYFHANSTGADSVASGANAVAIGQGALSDAQNTLAMGNGASAGGAAGKSSIAIGAGAQALTATNGDDGIRTGRSIAIGAQANANSAVYGNNTVIGAAATASGMNGVAIGLESIVTADNGGVTIGEHSTSSGTFATALGYGAIASMNKSVALGSFSTTDAVTNTTGATIGGKAYTFAGSNAGSTVSVGSAGAERTVTNVAAGRLSATSTDAVNGSQVFATDQAVNQNTTDITNAFTAINNVKSAGSMYFHANSTGADSTASGTNAIAIGQAATAGYTGDIAIGLNATTSGAMTYPAMAIGRNAQATATGTMALGVNALANVNAAIVLGYDSTSSGEHALALGANTFATAAGTSAVGGKATASASNATALGYGAKASDANSVALGANSTTAAVVSTTGATIGGKSYTFAGSNAGSTVSVGSAGAERTVTNVAAGQLSATSTDAVNGSQIFATDQAVNQNTTDIANAFTAINNVKSAGSMYFHANSTGADSVASGSNAIAIGQGALSDAKDTIAMGNGASAGGASGPSNIAIGAGAQALTATSAGDFQTGRSIAIGMSANANSAAYGNNTVIGAVATASGMNGVAIGVASRVSADNGGVAIGEHANSSGSFSEALGYGATASTNNSVALGAFSTTAAVTNTAGATIGGKAYTFAGSNAGSTVSVGSAGSERTVTNVAAGRLSATSTDAVNGSQLYAADQAIDQNTADISNAVNSINTIVATGTKYFHTNSTGADSVASGSEAIAIGSSATALGGHNVAIGYQSSTSVNGDLAIGGMAKATGTGSDGATAVGVNANANGSFSSAFGNHAKSGSTGDTAVGGYASATGGGVNGQFAVAMGYGASATNGATALGGNSNAAGAKSVALGSGAKASNANDIALGSNSTTANVVNTANATLGGKDYVFAGSNAGSTVSVGSAGAERTVTNVAAGRLSASSTDAVNGSQLFAADQAINQNAADINNAVNSINTIVATGTKYFHANSTGADSSAMGQDAVAIGQGAVATNANDIALGSNSITADVVNTAGATIGGKDYTFAGSNAQSTLSVGSLGAERTVTNVAAGRLSASSTDAVNGSQLFATNRAVDQNTADISNTVNSINTIVATGTKYFHTNSTGDDSTALGLDSVAIGQGAVAANANDIALGSNSTTEAVENTAGATIGGKDYTFAGSHAESTLSVGSVGAERTITNVAAGRLSASSTDAVNGSQLFATNQAVDQNTADISNTVNSINTIVATGTKYFHANSTGDDSTATGLDAIAIGQGAAATHANSIALGSNSITSEAVATAGIAINGINYAFAGSAPVGTLSVGSAGAERTITNVAAGRISATSTDAVNGSQLHATNQAVSSLQTEVSNISTDVNALNNASVKYDTRADGTPDTSSITLSGDAYDSATHTGGTAIHNVAYGVNGGDAVNVSQLNEVIGAVTNVANAANNPFMAAEGNRDTEGAAATGTHSTAMGALASASGARATAIGSGANASAANSVALGARSVADRENTVSVGSAGEERQITNVAAGTQGTDAVNLNQLNQSFSQGVNQANAYTDQKITALGSQVSSVARGAYAGVAAATALSMIPDVDPGKTIAVGIGTANYKGYQATALGASARVTANVKLKLGAGVSAAGTAVGGGASYQW
ncbi:YadA-like family protein [Caballeronia sp. LZ034LL]|nr:YadA-like family protein [Caballeronia sp. LZ034LL]